MDIQKEITIKLTELEYLMLKHFITRRQDDEEFDSGDVYDSSTNKFAVKFAALL